MSKVNNFCKRLKDILKAFGQAIGIIDVPQENRHNGRNESTHRVRNAKGKANIKPTKRSMPPEKEIVTKGDNHNDLFLLGASLHVINNHKGAHHKPDEREDIFDDYDYPYEDDDFLYEDEVYNEDYEDEPYEIIESYEDMDEY